MAESINTISQVYCFKGKVEVEKVEAAEAEAEVKAVEPLVIETNQMVSFASEPEAPPVKENFLPREIEEEINIFWDQNDFKGKLIDYPVIEEKQEMVEEKTEQAPETEEKQVEPEQKEKTVEEDAVFITEAEKAKKRKSFVVAGTTVVGIGVLTEVAGILLHFFGPTWFSGDASTYQDTGTVLMVAGGGITVGGLLTFLGIAVNQ